MPPPADLTNDRKAQHIAIINDDAETDRHRHYFDAIQLTHRALPEIALRDVEPATTFLGKTLAFPLLVSCMTGGSHPLTVTINRNLAEAAEAEGVALGVGSQRVMFASPEARPSFALRATAPSIPLLANLGAVQLNKGFGVEECREAVDVLGADALVLHLNPLQEAVQPEGDTDFSGLADKIGDIAEALAPVPVIVKEVGCGISRTDADLLTARGIRYLDVAGTGGTSWSRIENHRREDGDAEGIGLLFQDWGIPTPLALRSLADLRPEVTLIASGGIRNGLDIAKAVIMGATLGGLARPFLKPAMESADAVRSVIRRLRREFVTAMFLLGVTKVNSLNGREDLIRSAPWIQ